MPCQEIFSCRQWEIIESFQVGGFTVGGFGVIFRRKSWERPSDLVNNWDFSKGGYVFWRLLLSSTELRRLGLNLTIEFQVVLRRHIVKFCCFFCDIYSPDFARGIKYHFERKKPPHSWIWYMLKYACSLFLLRPLSDVCPHHLYIYQFFFFVFTLSLNFLWEIRFKLLI